MICVTRAREPEGARHVGVVGALAAVDAALEGVRQGELALGARGGSSLPRLRPGGPMTGAKGAGG